MSKIKVLALLATVSAAVLMVFSAAPARAAPPSHYHGGPAWHGDIRYFPRYDAHIWHGGRWNHGWYGGRFGWWWVVGPSWYYYPGPVYPYPNPYVPPVVINQTAAAPGPAPAQYWYYCAASKAYYPYVADCPAGWQKVPVMPPSAPPGQ